MRNVTVAILVAVITGTGVMAITKPMWDQVCMVTLVVVVTGNVVRANIGFSMYGYTGSSGDW